MSGPVPAITRLTRALADPATLGAMPDAGWSALIAVARAEALLGTLAWVTRDVAMPSDVRETLDAEIIASETAATHALWEAEMARRALAPIGVVPVLLKGTAYAAAALSPAPGRHIGDLDILVPRARLDDVEAALLTAGWEWVKTGDYDQHYYRDHMHELPPLIHTTRDRMIDVHHTILPLTHRKTPDAAAMLADAVRILPRPMAARGGEDGTEGGLGMRTSNPHPQPLPTGEGGSVPSAPANDTGMAAHLFILSPTDMVCHCAAHLIADGDLAGGLRNLWDMHCLLEQFGGDDAGFWDALHQRAVRHQLLPVVQRAARLAHRLYGTAIPAGWRRVAAGDALFLRRLTARNDWGQPTRPATQMGFYVRSHAMRMPPVMLARHLWVKWRSA